MLFIGIYKQYTDVLHRQMQIKIYSCYVWFNLNPNVRQITIYFKNSKLPEHLILITNTDYKAVTPTLSEYCVDHFHRRPRADRVSEHPHEHPVVRRLHLRFRPCAVACVFVALQCGPLVHLKVIVITSSWSLHLEDVGLKIYLQNIPGNRSSKDSSDANRAEHMMWRGTRK